MKVLMTGGGTGGHVNPAIAIADKIKEKERSQGMGIKEKLAHAKKTDWIREGFTDEEVREIVESAKNEAKNFRKELEAKNSEKNVKEEN